MKTFRIFLFGSYAVNKSNEKSDLDVFITNNKLSGFDVLEPEMKELNEFIERFKDFALENKGILDLFLDRGNEFHAVYSDFRRLFGKSFAQEFDYITQICKEITPDELETILKANNHQERCRIIQPILQRNQFLS